MRQKYTLQGHRPQAAPGYNASRAKLGCRKGVKELRLQASSLWPADAASGTKLVSPCLSDALSTEAGQGSAATGPLAAARQMPNSTCCVSGARQMLSV